jgi:hypothetical protein
MLAVISSTTAVNNDELLLLLQSPLHARSSSKLALVYVAVCIHAAACSTTCATAALTALQVCNSTLPPLLHVYAVVRMQTHILLTPVLRHRLQRTRMTSTMM